MLPNAMQSGAKYMSEVLCCLVGPMELITLHFANNMYIVLTSNYILDTPSKKEIHSKEKLKSSYIKEIPE